MFSNIYFSKQQKKTPATNTQHIDKSSGPPTHYTYRSCAALETQAMKLPAHSSFADVNFIGLKLCIRIYCKS